MKAESTLGVDMNIFPNSPNFSIYYLFGMCDDL